MAAREVFRYSWIKVSDADGRAHMMRSAFALPSKLVAMAQSAIPGSDEARFLRNQLVMARAYLGGDLESGIRSIIDAIPKAASLSVDLLATTAHAISHGGSEIVVATMPPGYTRDDALAWLRTPVGETWSHGALACRLAHAVVSADEVIANQAIDNEAGLVPA